MGVRLYPLESGQELYEKLARVPSGTYLRLMQRQKNEVPREFMEEAFGDVEYARWLWIRSDWALEQLDHFITFGYGKFSLPVDDYCGQTDDPIHAAMLYKSASNHHCFDLDPAGVSWG